MAVYDLWYRRIDGKKTPTALHGKGQRWQARWRDTDQSQKKRNFTTKDEAERHLAELRVTPQTRDAETSVAQQYGRWIASKGTVRRSTLSDYEQKWRLNVEPYWGDRQLGSIRHSEVAAWVGELTVRKSATTARRSYMVLSGVFRQAAKDGLLSADPTAGVSLPVARKTDVAPLTVAQVAALAEACAPHQTVVWVLALAGVRFGEMAGLRAADLDVTRRRLRITRTLSEVNGTRVEELPKNGRRRDVAIPQWLVGRLVTDRPRTDPLLPTTHGQPWRSGSWKRVWGPARASVGLPDVRVHDLRHTAASLAIAAGANVKAVQAMLGHQSAAMTLDLYSHLFEDGLDDVAARMGALVADY